MLGSRLAAVSTASRAARIFSCVSLSNVGIRAEALMRRRDGGDTARAWAVIEQHIATAIDLRIDETGPQPGTPRQMPGGNGGELALDHCIQDVAGTPDINCAIARTVTFGIHRFGSTYHTQRKVTISIRLSST